MKKEILVRISPTLQKLEELRRSLEEANLQIVSAWYGHPAKGVIEEVSEFFPKSYYPTYIVEKDNNQ